MGKLLAVDQLGGGIEVHLIGAGGAAMAAALLCLGHPLQAKTGVQALSERRAMSVRQALAVQGVDPGRIDTRGLGEAYPVATNDTVAGRQLNRRVEVVIRQQGDTTVGAGTAGASSGASKPAPADRR